MKPIRNCILTGALAFFASRNEISGYQAGTETKATRENTLFVCICNALNDRTVNELVASGAAATPAAIHRAAGCKPQCGRCLPDMAEIIAEHRTARSFAQAAD